MTGQDPKAETEDGGESENDQSLVTECINTCLASNQLRTCKFLCNPISTIKKLAKNPIAKQIAMKKGQSIIEEIKELSKSIAKSKGKFNYRTFGQQGREEGAPQIPETIPTGGN